MTTKTILRASAILGWLLAACSEPAAPSTPDIVPPPLAVRTDAASAAECAFGGSVVRTGLDDDRDGALEDSEATSRSVVCNPAPTPLPPVILVRLAAEKPGASCGAGGTAVQSGPDLNGNGVLDDDEVAHIDYACGQALFTRLAIEPAGPNCSIGGVAFFAGRDRDGDGVLEDAEVETRHFECGDVVASDVTISSDADVAALADVRIISGTVQAQFASLSEISLAKLEHVGGGFRILDSLGRRPIRIALPQLQEVDGAFEVRGSLGEIACPQLRRVGSLTLDSTGLTDVRGFPALATVDGDVTIEFNDLLVSADLPRISVGGDVAIDFNDQLASLTWNLQGRVGNVSIQDNAKLASIDLAVADGLGVPSQIGHITVFGEDAMNRLAVSAARADGLSVNFNAQITDLAVDVATFDGDLTIFGIATPFHLDLTPFRADRIAIAGRLLVSSPLQSIALAAPLTVGDLCVFDATQLTRFDPGSPLTVRGGVRFSANPQLTSIVPIAMLPRASLQVISNAVLPRINFLTLQDHQIGAVVITDNPALVDASSLTGVTEVHGEVDVERNASLTALFDASLRAIEGPVFIEDNASLAALSYPGLEHVLSDLLVERNPVLQTIEVPKLIEAADELFIDNNPQLRHIALDALTHADLFFVGNNPKLPACEVLAIFTHVTGVAKSQSGNDNTATCGP